MRRSPAIVAAVLLLGGAPAAETIQVSRDARGRVVVTNARGGAYARPAPRPGQATPAPREAGPGDLRKLIQAAAERYGLPVGLLRSVVAVESSFDPQAVSPKGARGLMQLMPATARELGVEDVYDPAQNLDGGARHLRRLLERYEGDLRLALAAYNAGEEAVARHGGVPPFQETRNYVRRVLERVEAAREAAPGGARRLVGYRDARGTLVFSNRPPAAGPSRRGSTAAGAE